MNVTLQIRQPIYSNTMDKNTEILEKIDYMAELESRFVTILSDISENIDRLGNRLDRIEQKLDMQKYGSYPEYGTTNLFNS